MAVSRLAERVGLVLGGRYRLLAPIGTGASASVYLADDTVLRRRVAVKILHAALADDEAFLRRFRAEAQAAAALNHPHVMAVYDWGQDAGADRVGGAGAPVAWADAIADPAGGIPYLVTEYLGGGSLRGMLDQGSRLSPAQALLVGLETARGLEYAHRRGFVHRDIKPANLLFDEDARLRIADFGLARALAEAAWTEPMGAVLGTARYASPEQARGESLDFKSDVYSLALVIVEAVSGQVPFATDTTIGTLMARVNQPLPVPDELGALGDPLRWAGHPDPRRRPDAAEFGAALMAAASGFDRPAPLPLAGAKGLRDLAGFGPDPTAHPPRATDAAVPFVVAPAVTPLPPVLPPVLPAVLPAVLPIPGAPDVGGPVVGGPVVGAPVVGAPIDLRDEEPAAGGPSGPWVGGSMLIGAGATGPHPPAFGAGSPSGEDDAVTVEDPGSDHGGGAAPTGAEDASAPAPAEAPRRRRRPRVSHLLPMTAGPADLVDDVATRPDLPAPVADGSHGPAAPAAALGGSAPATDTEPVLIAPVAATPAPPTAPHAEPWIGPPTAPMTGATPPWVGPPTEALAPPIGGPSGANPSWGHGSTGLPTAAWPVDPGPGPTVTPDAWRPDPRTATVTAVAGATIEATATMATATTAPYDTGRGGERHVVIDAPAAIEPDLDPDRRGPSARGQRRAERQARADDERRRRQEQRATRPPRRRWPAVLLALFLVTGVAAGGYAYWYTEVRIPFHPMPALVGKNIAELDNLIGSYGWQVTRDTRFDDAAPLGQILAQNPPPATQVARGATIAVVTSNGPPPVTVPTSLAGQTLDEATASLAAIGLGVGDVSRTYDEDAPAGTVLAVAKGTPAQVIKGGDVGLVVSSGPEPRIIPDGLVGKPVDQATATLKGLGLSVKTSEDFSDSIATGNVISVNPGVGASAEKGSTVQVVVSKGPPLVAVPDVKGLSVDDAATKLEAAGFTVSDVKGSPRKDVTATDPPAGTMVKPGSDIVLTTSKVDNPLGGLIPGLG